MHEGERTEVAHLVRHVAGDYADPLVTVDDPAVDQMAGLVLRVLASICRLAIFGGRIIRAQAVRT